MASVISMSCICSGQCDTIGRTRIDGTAEREEAGSVLIIVNLQSEHRQLGGNFSYDSSGQDATCSLMTNQLVDSELRFLSGGTASVRMSQF